MNKILSRILFLSAIVIALPFFNVNAEESALSISCKPSNSKVMIGENVTWTATVSGGAAPYSSFDWEQSSLGSSSIDGSEESTTMTYGAAGSYGAQFVVMDRDFTAHSVECSRVQVVAPVEFVSCSPSPATSNTGYETIWNVVVKGGVAPYTLNISGDDGLSGTGLSTEITYTTAGTKKATVTNITSSFADAGTLAGPFECKTATVYTAPTELKATCSVDKTSIKEGESVTWSANVSGGTAPYTYKWSGSDSLSGTGETASKTYSAQGTKTATLEVMDSTFGPVAEVNCSQITVSEKTTTTSGSGGGSSSSSGSSRSSRTTSSTSTNATTTTRTVATAEVPVNTVTFANNTVTANRPVVANNAGAKATTTVATGASTATSTSAGIDEANLLASAGAFGFIKDNKIISTIIALLILGLAWFIVFFKRRKKEEETPTTN